MVSDFSGDTGGIRSHVHSFVGLCGKLADQPDSVQRAFRETEWSLTFCRLLDTQPADKGISISSTLMGSILETFTLFGRSSNPRRTRIPSFARCSWIDATYAPAAEIREVHRRFHER